MRHRRRRSQLLRSLLLLLLSLPPALAAGPAAAAPDPAQLARGAYLVRAGACASCHTDARGRGGWLAGGRAMATPYGTFQVPNITPDPLTGIGGWSQADFKGAMTEGVSPDGAYYFPIFPYRWYRHLKDEDLAAMKAYLDAAVPPVRQAEPPHELLWGIPPWLLRPFILGWQWLNMQADEGIPPAQGALAGRGWYLVNALGHCGACHTPAWPGYIYKEDAYLAGHEDIPGSYPASNLTPEPTTGIGRWSEADLVRSLELGMRPDGTPLRGPMAEYVAEGSRHLTPADRAAVAAYLRQIPPRRSPIAEEPTTLAQPEAHDEAPVGGAPLGADLVLGGRVAITGLGRPADACQACHAPDLAPHLADGTPRLDGQAAAYLARQLDGYALGTRQSPVMGPIAARLAPAERAAVAAWYAALPGPAAPTAPPVGGNDRGQTLALLGDPALGVAPCIACHGTLGVGVPPAFPYLAGQDPLYMALQLTLWRRGERRNDPLAAMREIAQRLPPADALAVSAWFGALPYTAAPGSSPATAGENASPRNGSSTATPASSAPSPMSSERRAVQPAAASVASSSASQ